MRACEWNHYLVRPVADVRRPDGDEEDECGPERGLEPGAAAGGQVANAVHRRVRAEVTEVLGRAAGPQPDRGGNHNDEFL